MQVCMCVCVFQCTMFAAEQEMSTCCLFIFSAHLNVKLHDFFYIFTVAVAATAAATSVLLLLPLPSPLVVCHRVVWQFLCENIFSGTFEDSWAQQQGTHTKLMFAFKEAAETSWTQLQPSVKYFNVIYFECQACTDP